MTKVTVSAEIDFDQIEDSIIDAAFRNRKGLMEKLADEILDEQEPAKARDFDTSDLVQALNMRGFDPAPYIDDVYQMVAEGRTEDALDEIYRNNPKFTPPSSAKRLADLLTIDRG